MEPNQKLITRNIHNICIRTLLEQEICDMVNIANLKICTCKRPLMEVINEYTFKVHMNRKFFLCRFKLSPLKYTISKFETFGVKIGDVTGVQSYAFCPEKWSSNRAAKRPKCHVM